jgi:hypothetical protein
MPPLAESSTELILNWGAMLNSVFLGEVTLDSEK